MKNYTTKNKLADAGKKIGVLLPSSENPNK
jgi:hypothetical protein